MKHLGPFSSIRASSLLKYHKIIDFVSINASFLLLFSFSVPPSFLWLSFSCLLISSYIATQSSNLYSSLFIQDSTLLRLRRILSCLVFAAASLFALLYLFRLGTFLSRTVFLQWFLLCLSLLSFNHLALRPTLASLSSLKPRTLICISSPDSAARLISRLSSDRASCWKVLASFSPSTSESEFLALGHDQVPVFSLDYLHKWLQANSPDLILFDVYNLTSSVQSLLSILGDTTIPVLYAPGWVDPTMRFKLDHFGSQPVLEIWGEPYFRLHLIFKRAADILVSLLLLLLLFPLLLIITIIIPLSSSGSPFFLQRRSGLDSREFFVFKFRTMYTATGSCPASPNQASVNDPRVTRIGRFLRRTSLDELPQLLNVLLGDMSLVGPRPHAVEHNAYYRQHIPGYMQRHSVKPGITGLAQVNGLRGETPCISLMARRLQCDLEYQRKWSLRLDFKILMLTLASFTGPSAY